MKQIIVPLLAVAAFITIVGIFTQKVQNNDLKFFSQRQVETVQKKEIKLGETNIKVEIADTEIARNKGLSKRKELPEDEGLLFVFNSQDIKPAFWMKDMLFPIDIIWIDDNKVVQIDKNISPPDKDTPEEKLRLYVPNEPIDYVLEVNAGFSDKKNIKVQTSVDLGQINK